MSHREYDLIVLGATGYTGKNVAEYVTTKLTTNLRWAVAGRSLSRLASLVDELKLHHSDRIQPGWSQFARCGSDVSLNEQC